MATYFQDPKDTNKATTKQPLSFTIAVVDGNIPMEYSAFICATSPRIIWPMPCVMCYYSIEYTSFGGFGPVYVIATRRRRTTTTTTTTKTKTHAQAPGTNAWKRANHPGTGAYVKCPGVGVVVSGDTLLYSVPSFAACVCVLSAPCAYVCLLVLASAPVRNLHNLWRSHTRKVELMLMPCALSLSLWFYLNVRMHARHTRKALCQR